MIKTVVNVSAPVVAISISGVMPTPNIVGIFRVYSHLFIFSDIFSSMNANKRPKIINVKNCFGLFNIFVLLKIATVKR